MGDGMDKRPDEQDYHFIKETIKRKPVDKRALAGRIAAIIGGGVLFGICAAAAIASTAPALLQRFGTEAGQQGDVKLTTPPPEMNQAAAPTGQAEPAATPALQDTAASLTPLDDYEEIYSEVLKVSEEPRKALVTVSGITGDANLLDNSFLRCGSSEGIIFLENNSNLYILTYEDGLREANRLQVTFSDGTTADAQLCKADDDTGIAVVRVPVSSLDSNTRDSISVAMLGNSYSLLQAKPVIAIGSPAGDRDAVVYGMVTSVSGRLTVSDAEYNLMATDMQGSPDGSGILLDTAGKVIGFIVKQEAETTNIIRALSISQLRPLIEMLSNSEPVKYLGIHGISITDTQAVTRGIPKGIFVDSVDSDSPAMVAGIQNGDIIRALNGNTLKNMQSYTTRLQKLETGERVTITIARKSADDLYVEMDFQVTIEER
ncbi:MAG: S1C family serine protease [Eubacteriales bacterium]|nr:S1C family serine protease [Eubacteriales bacterium]